MTEIPDDDHGDADARAVVRTLWGRDDPADPEEDAEDRKQGNYVPREGGNPPRPGVDDEREFVRQLFSPSQSAYY